MYGGFYTSIGSDSSWGCKRDDYSVTLNMGRVVVCLSRLDLPDLFRELSASEEDSKYKIKLEDSAEHIGELNNQIAVLRDALSDMQAQVHTTDSELSLLTAKLRDNPDSATRRAELEELLKTKDALFDSIKSEHAALVLAYDDMESDLDNEAELLIEANKNLASVKEMLSDIIKQIEW